MMSKFAIFDQQDNMVYAAWSDADGSVNFDLSYGPEEIVKRLHQDAANSKLEIHATRESIGLVEQIEGINSKVNIQLIPRLLAIYYCFRKQVEDRPCLVLSVELNSAHLGFLRDGTLEIESEIPHVSLRGVWNRFVLNTQHLKRPIERLKKRYPQVQDDVFKDFQDVLQGIREKRRGPIPFNGKINLSSSFKALKNALGPFASDLKSPKHLILSNWAACGNLPELLEKQGYVVHSSQPESCFQDAVRGLVLWRLSQKESVDTQTVKGGEGESVKQQEATGGAKQEDLLIECTSCGKKNRIPARHSKKYPICGACKKPLPHIPSILFQQGKDSLSGGEYDKAIKCFKELLQEDKSNRLFQTLWLLANIKHYKSIQGYEKKIAEVREWGELTQDEKPWVKEILTLAAKEYLEKGNIESAEENLGRAYEIDSSGEVAVLLGRVKQAKGDQALRKGNLQEAQAFYEEALGKDPENQDYPKYQREVSKLVESQRAKKRRVVRASLILIAILVIGIWFVRKGEKVSPPVPVKIASSRVDADKQELKVNERVKLRFIGKYSDGSEAEITKAMEWQSSDASVATVSQEGEVEGKKVGHTNITAHYGGLVSPPVSLFVTDERPLEKVASPKGSLKTKEGPRTAVVASEKIEDHIKVARWDRDNGRYEDALTALEKAKSLDPSNAEILRELEITRKAQDAEKNILGDRVAGEKSLPEAKQTETAGTWSYEAVRAAYVFERPSLSSNKLARVDKGTKITVVRSMGDWLEVRSKQGNPPGFIRRDDAKYLGTAN